MKAFAFIIGLSAWMLSSCTDNLNETMLYNEPVLLTGRHCEEMYAVASSSVTQETLSDGSRILVHATGCLQLSEEILTYQNNHWEAEHPLQWNNETTSTQLTAIYPVYADLKYQSANLYANNTLADVLYIRENFPGGSPIHFRFKHLFSRLSLRLAPELQNQLQKLEITCPHTVSSIDPITARFTLSRQTPHTTTLLPNPSGSNYSILVPPSDNCTLTLKITTSGKSYLTSLTIPQLQSGKNYSYYIKRTESTPGIATVEDWIAFNKLMSTPYLQSYNGKTLDDFRKTENGITTYYLLNDLDFTGIDPELTKTIPSNQKNSYYINDIFDGKGHTLSNLTIKPRNGGCGIFTGIDKQGCLKNLHIKNSNIVINQKENSFSTGIGILAGGNHGSIHNCSVENCKIQINKGKESYSIIAGGLVGTSTGAIYNCSARHVSINFSPEDRQNSIGGMVGVLYGMLTNCYAADLTINSPKANAGGICGQALHAQVENCYLYHLSIGNSHGIFAKSITDSYFQYLYYEQSPIATHKQESNSIIKYNQPFTSISELPIARMLNIWIKRIAPVNYPKYNYTPWEKGNELPAVFSIQ